jgi:hypothetical protein
MGLATGYYFGAKAGRERYVQLNSWLRKAMRSPVYDEVAEKAKEFIHDHRHNGHSVPEPVSTTGF